MRQARTKFNTQNLRVLLPLLLLAAPFPIAALADVAARFAARDFPSIFMAWNTANNLPGEDPDVTVARHDLLWKGVGYYGLQWDTNPIGLSEAFTPASIPAGLAKRAALQALNPNLIHIAEIRYRDAPGNFLPEDHEWWQYDGMGNRVPGWVEGGYFKLDYNQAAFRQHVAQRCKAAIDSGVFDGCFLDWWRENEPGFEGARIALAQEVRNTIGNDALIIVNVNNRQAPLTAQYLNGVFMEVYDTSTPQEWQKGSRGVPGRR